MWQNKTNLQWLNLNQGSFWYQRVALLAKQPMASHLSNSVCIAGAFVRSLVSSINWLVNFCILSDILQFKILRPKAKIIHYIKICFYTFLKLSIKNSHVIFIYVLKLGLSLIDYTLWIGKPISLFLFFLKGTFPIS